ncbi:MAG: hypothetical protein V8S36_08405 [Lachnospiraceae bacterium]
MYLYSLDPTVDTAWKQIGDQEITGNPSSGMDFCFNGEKIYVMYYGSQQVIESKVWTGSAWETFCPKIAVQDVSSLDTYYQDGKVYLRFVDNGTAAYRSCAVTPETGKPDPTPDPPTEPEQPTEPPQPSEPEKPTTPSKPEVPATPSPPTQPSKPEEPDNTAAALRAGTADHTAALKTRAVDHTNTANGTGDTGRTGTANSSRRVGNSGVASVYGR